MRRILLLGMAVLLGLAAHADDRQVVFEETFAEGLGDFTVVDEGFLRIIIPNHGIGIQKAVQR